MGDGRGGSSGGRGRRRRRGVLWRGLGISEDQAGVSRVDRSGSTWRSVTGAGPGA